MINTRIGVPTWALGGFGLVLGLAVLCTMPASADASGRGVVSVVESGSFEEFEVRVDGRELPRNLASARHRFGRPASRRHVGYRRDPECGLRWPSLHITATFYHGYGGVRSSCAPAAGTLVAEFGAGWSTDLGLRVGASVAEMRAAYPSATRRGAHSYPGTTRHGSIWALVESLPPWGTVDVLAGKVRNGRVVALLAAGPEAWDE